MEARLQARPLLETVFVPVGLQPLMFGTARDSYLYVPTTYRADRPAPLVLLLHDAGGHARRGAVDRPLQPQDRSRAGAGRLRRVLQGIRRWAHDLARDRLGGSWLVYAR